MTQIARCNNVALIESGRILRLVEQGGSWVPTARYVTALIAIIVGLNGVANTRLPIDARLGMLTVGVLFAAAAAWLHAQRKAQAKSPKAGVTILTFDFGEGQLRDASGRALAPIAEVHLERTWQLASSSRALSLRHASFGRIVVARGNPFGDAVAAIEDALIARGIRKGSAF